jgi:hypothetical protein
MTASVWLAGWFHWVFRGKVRADAGYHCDPGSQQPRLSTDLAARS